MTQIYYVYAGDQGKLKEYKVLSGANSSLTVLADFAKNHPNLYVKDVSRKQIKDKNQLNYFQEQISKRFKNK